MPRGGKIAAVNARRVRLTPVGALGRPVNQWTVSGYVLNADRSPVSGFTVAVTISVAAGDGTTYTVTKQATTGTNGHYSMVLYGGGFWKINEQVFRTVTLPVSPVTVFQGARSTIPLAPGEPLIMPDFIIVTP